MEDKTLQLKKKLLICGSLAFDELFFYSGEINEHLSQKSGSPLYVNIRAEGPVLRRGGCGGNVAYSSTLFEIPSAILSWIGSDGENYLNFLKKGGVDTSTVILAKGKSTPRAILLSDKIEDQFLIFSTQKAPENWSLPVSDNFLLAVVTAGVPESTIGIISYLKRRKIPFIIDPGKFIMDIPAGDLLWCIEGSDTLVLNSYEKELLLSQTGKKWREILQMTKRVVETRGAEGAVIETHSRREKVPAAHPAALKDPYGAGDAFLGGYAAARYLGYQDNWAARIGTVCASFAIEKEGTQAYSFTFPDFILRIGRTHGQPETALKDMYNKRGLPYPGDRRD